jgi:ribonuclease-3
VLGLAVADLLYREFPTGSEGDLSRRLGHLVRKETCAEVSVAWGAGEHIRVGASEGGLRRKEAILADVCESLIAAVYLDAGFEAARGVVERAFGPKVGEPGRATRDPKSMLQEWALGQGRPVPVYTETDRTGPDHAPKFKVTAVVEGFEPCVGEGRSKRQAEMAAAEAMLRREGVMAGASP